jgi:hypothetical protein
MKKQSEKQRNPYAQDAAKRKGGPMRSKKDKRKNGKNKLQEILKEIDS